MLVLWFTVVYYGIVAAVSIFGFIGCLLRRPAFISVYNVALWTLLALDLISFIITLYHLYRGDTSEVRGLESSARAGSDSSASLRESPGVGRLSILLSLSPSGSLSCVCAPLAQQADLSSQANPRWLLHCQAVCGATAGRASRLRRHHALAEARRQGGKFCLSQAGVPVTIYITREHVNQASKRCSCVSIP
jgi:hypothetical protein